MEVVFEYCRVFFYYYALGFGAGFFVIDLELMLFLPNTRFWDIDRYGLSSSFFMMAWLKSSSYLVFPFAFGLGFATDLSLALDKY